MKLDKPLKEILLYMKFETLVRFTASPSSNGFCLLILSNFLLELTKKRSSESVAQRDDPTFQISSLHPVEIGYSRQGRQPRKGPARFELSVCPFACSEWLSRFSPFVPPSFLRTVKAIHTSNFR